MTHIYWPLELREKKIKKRNIEFHLCLKKNINIFI